MTLNNKIQQIAENIVSDELNSLDIEEILEQEIRDIISEDLEDTVRKYLRDAIDSELDVNAAIEEAMEWIQWT